MSIQETVVTFLSQIEGDYKWYVIGLIALVLTGLVTRFIFKTFKWFILLIILGALIVALFGVLANLATL